MIDVKEIQSLIPHRYPFLLVDRITELVPGEKIVGIKNVTINEPFFQGHFPGNPIMPGVLIVEAMAQVSGVLGFKSGQAGNTVLFLSIDKAKFRKPVVPGDQLIMEVTLLQQRRGIYKFAGKATVGDDLVCESDFSAMITDREI